MTSEDKQEEQGFSIDKLMDRVIAEGRTQLPGGELDQLLNEVHSPRWLVLQNLLNMELNGKLHAMSMQPVAKEGAILEMARLQGEIAGIRRFWYTLEELANKREAPKDG